jgi:hypothetical protein
VEEGRVEQLREVGGVGKKMSKGWKKEKNQVRQKLRQEE